MTVGSNVHHRREECGGGRWASYFLGIDTAYQFDNREKSHQQKRIKLLNRKYIKLSEF